MSEAFAWRVDASDTPQVAFARLFFLASGREVASMRALFLALVVTEGLTRVVLPGLTKREMRHDTKGRPTH